MSDLDAPRIQFFGKFFADTSTDRGFGSAVTRDLSASDRVPIESWIKNGCPQGGK